MTRSLTRTNFFCVARTFIIKKSKLKAHFKTGSVIILFVLTFACNWQVKKRKPILTTDDFKTLVGGCAGCYVISSFQNLTLLVFC